MKKLNLIRHAKSSWDDPDISDIERPLNKRGIRSCELMARPIFGRSGVSKNIFCSPASRAHLTVKYMSQQIPEETIKWQIIDTLYCFESARLLNWCRSLDESYVDVTIIGHNPALTELIYLLCRNEPANNIENIPTCGFVQLSSQQDVKWQNINKGSFTLDAYIWPKSLPNWSH